MRQRLTTWPRELGMASPWLCLEAVAPGPSREASQVMVTTRNLSPSLDVRKCVFSQIVEIFISNGLTA